MIWSNLAVSDLERTTKFFTELGFKPNGSPTEEITSFVVGSDDFVMHFFIKDKLRTEIKGELADLKQGNEIIFSLSAESKEEVNLWAKEVQKAGGKLVSNRRNLEKDIMVLFSPTLTVISLMCFICKFFSDNREARTHNKSIANSGAGR